jgi:hypothetical protein
MSTTEASLATSSLERLVPFPGYQTLPIDQGFNWAEALADCEVRDWYLVVFRSLRKKPFDVQALAHYDGLAFAEAARIGGLLTYFKGDVNEAAQCLSFCLWERRDQARAAMASPQHIEAAKRTKRWYRSYQIERYALRKAASQSEPEFVRLTD